MTSHPSPVNWLDLPDDLCSSIIRRLHAVEILTSVQYVCPMWRRICRDPSMWTSIDVVEYNNERTNVPRDLSKLYRLAVDLSSGGLVYLNFDYHYNSDGLLQYVADRSKHLRRIRLGHCLDLSKREFFDAVEKLPALEELDISKSIVSYYCSSESIATISRLCPLLSSFKFDVVSDDIAFAIGRNMSALRHLHIYGSWVDKNGFLAILDGCRHLESLDLSDCFVILDETLKRRCSEQVKDFRGPQDYDVHSLYNEEFGRDLIRLSDVILGLNKFRLHCTDESSDDSDFEV